ncbi:putative ubiquitin conjugating enzyme [Biscogniauxia mediterranea]|nr:putative ubiquitin conjugating enzyme [Biscogniauxia mediterranea]
MYRDIATAVYKRGEASMNGYQMPGWAWGVFFLDFILFFPFFLVVNYSFQHVFPTLAIVEDPSPPAYEPVSLNDETQSLAEDNAPIADEAATNGEAQVVTSSFRGIYRTLVAVGGWRSMFRGIACWFAASMATVFLYGIFTSAWIPGLIAAPLSAVVLVQLYTAWTHIVISSPSPKRFWQRLPPFKKAFQATALPVVVYFFAMELSSFLPKGLAYIMGMNLWDSSKPGTIPESDVNDIWKGVIVLLVSLVMHIFLVIPAQVVLTRVQASLLPEEDDTIVPFDRSFQSKVEPAIVGGKGFVSMIDAWKTFSRASWTRLVKLYLKIFLASVAISILWVAVLVPEVIVIMNHSKKIE